MKVTKKWILKDWPSCRDKYSKNKIYWYIDSDYYLCRTLTYDADGDLFSHCTERFQDDELCVMDEFAFTEDLFVENSVALSDWKKEEIYYYWVDGVTITVSQAHRVGSVSAIVASVEIEDGEDYELPSKFNCSMLLTPENGLGFWPVDSDLSGTQLNGLPVVETICNYLHFVGKSVEKDDVYYILLGCDVNAPLVAVEGVMSAVEAFDYVYSNIDRVNIIWLRSLFKIISDVDAFRYTTKETSALAQKITDAYDEYEQSPVDLAKALFDIMRNCETFGAYSEDMAVLTANHVLSPVNKMIDVSAEWTGNPFVNLLDIK